MNQYYHSTLDVCPAPIQTKDEEWYTRFGLTSDLSKKIEAWDGLVGAFLDHNTLVTSPNCTFVPTAIAEKHVVRLCTDYRFGQDDFTQWPQPITLRYNYISAIPAMRNDPSDPLHVMWLDPKRTDFEVKSGYASEGLGRYSPSFLAPFIPLHDDLIKRARQYMESKGESAYSQEIIKRLMSQTIFLISQLRRHARVEVDMQMTLTEFQRCHLELHGVLDYNQIYFPKMISGVSDDFSNIPPTAKAVGGFTTDIRVVQEYYQAGLPVWFVRARKDIGSTINVHNLVKPTPPEVFICTDPAPGFNDVFEGYWGDKNRILAMHLYSRHRMVPCSPFEAERLELEPLSSLQQMATIKGTAGPLDPEIGPSRSLREQREVRRPYPETRPGIYSGLSHYVVSNRAPHGNAVSSSSRSQSRSHGKTKKASPQLKPNTVAAVKFQEKESRFNPPVREAWTTATAALVNRPQQGKRFANDGHYCFPNPSSIYGANTEERAIDYAIAWMIFRQLALLRYTRTKPERAMAGQEWKDFLMVSVTGLKPGTRAYPAALRALKIFGCEEDGALELLQDPGEEVINFKKALENDPSRTMKKMLFELYELNFRMELLELDRRCQVMSRNEKERERLILRCFPSVDADHFIANPLLTVSPSATRSSGICSESWQTRHRYLSAMVDVMRGWDEKDIPLKEFLLAGNDRVTERDVLTLEEAVARHYACKFFDNFGRPPVLPHYIAEDC